MKIFPHPKIYTSSLWPSKNIWTPYSFNSTMKNHPITSLHAEAALGTEKTRRREYTISREYETTWHLTEINHEVGRSCSRKFLIQRRPYATKQTRAVSAAGTVNTGAWERLAYRRDLLLSQYAAPFALIYVIVTTTDVYRIEKSIRTPATCVRWRWG